MPLAALADPGSTPLLFEGDSLTSEEFLRRWEDIPDLKHAELIDGIVYMPLPVSCYHQNWFVSSGTPELIVEVAVTSRSRDFGAKKRLYERAGVREYLIAVPPRQEFAAFSLTPFGFRPRVTDADGIFRSEAFPGMWLDTKALWARDRQGRNAALQQGLVTPEHAEFVAQMEARKL